MTGIAADARAGGFRTAFAAPRAGLIASLGLALFTWLLPFHSLTISILHGPLQVPEEVARLVAAWKEALVVALLGWLVVRHAIVRDPDEPRRLNPYDAPVAVLFALALIAFVIGSAIEANGLTVAEHALALRDSVFFVMIFVIGRRTHALAADPAVLRRLLLVGVVTSLLGVIEVLVLPLEALVFLGVPQYFNEFLNVDAFTAGTPLGLPHSYWTGFGANSFRRAGSVYLSPQSFAIASLLMVPASTVALLSGRRRGWALFAAAAVWLGLIVSVTRMTLVVCMIQVLVLLFLYRRWWMLLLAAWLMTIAVTLALVLLPGIAEFVWATITWETLSSGSHLKDWTLAIEAMAERPWGWGIGTSDQSAVRLGLPPITNDNLFFKYGVELGLAGLFAFVAMFVALARVGVKLYADGARTPAERELGAVVVAATIGIALNGITAVLTHVTTLTYLFFWLAGTATARLAIAPRRG